MAQIIFNEIPLSNPDLNAPGRGAEQWHDRVDVNVPVEGTKTIPKDRYQRFVTTRIANATKGSYNWTFFDNLVKECIANNQKLSFGYMTVYTDGTENEGLVRFSDGSYAAYPQWVQTAMMQNGGLKPWKYDNYNIPNYNNTAYLDWLLELNKAIDSHIKTTTINGVPMKNVVNIIDIRGMGNWGEWHHYPYVGDYPNKLPAGQQPTFASLKRIVDAFLQGFPDNPLVAMISAHDREFFVNTWNPPAISDYLATAKNNWGGVGYRNDHWGGLDTYTWTYLDHPALANVWKTGWITGEPPGSVNGTNNMGDLVRQVQKYHVSTFGNGNMGGGESNSTVRNNVRAASKAAGYRLVVQSADITTTGKSVAAKLNWINKGIAAPKYPWDIMFDLIKSGAIVKSAKSTFGLKLFQPAGVASTAVDNLSFDVPDGTYELRFRVVDPGGFWKPMPLYIQGGSADGYSLGNVTLSGGVTPPPVNKPPVVSAGPDREITLPTKVTTLVGSVSDTDGTIPADGITWEQIDGPTSFIVTPKVATTTINLSVAGTYRYRITGKDNLGATSVDEVSVKVNPENTPPPPQKTVVNVTNVSTVSTVSTVHYSDGSTEVFPKV